MDRLKVEPRTPEWHEARADAWTASMAAVIAVPANAALLQTYAASKGVTLHIDELARAGVTSFFGNTLWTVWAGKVGRIPRFKGNVDTERGQANEENVMKLFEREKMFIVEREVTAYAAGSKWLLASFDGVVPQSSDIGVRAPNGFPLEAKCPAFQSRRKLFESKKSGQLAIMGLPYYWCQVQHQIAVADAPYGWFAAAGFDEKTGAMVFPIMEKVPRDDVFLDQYLAAAKFFYDEFIYTGAEPPRLPSDEQLLADLAEKAAFDKALKEENLEAASELYLASLATEKEVIERRKALEKKLVEAARKRRLKPDEDEDVELDGLFKVSFAMTSSVSWQKVAESLSPGGIGEATIKACTGKPRESVKVKPLEV